MNKWRIIGQNSVLDNIGHRYDHMSQKWSGRWLLVAKTVRGRSRISRVVCLSKRERKRKSAAV